MTPAKLKLHTVKDLAAMAKQREIPGWHAMRKEELVHALVNSSRAEQRRLKRRQQRKVQEKVVDSAKSHKPSRKSPNKSPGKSTGTKPEKTTQPARSVARSRKNGSAGAVPSTKKSSSRTHQSTALVEKHIAQLKDTIARRKELDRLKQGELGVQKDRLILLVRDPYWLHVYWELSSQSVERARAAMGPYWHSAQPILRLLKINSSDKTNVERELIRDIKIHGGVNNWYIDVHDPPNHFQVEIGYLGANGKFYALACSNSVETPTAGRPVDGLDGNWAEVAEDFDRIFAMSGGYENTSEDLQDVFEERLKRPVGSSIPARIGSCSPYRHRREIQIDIDAEMVVFGTVDPNVYLSIKGQPIRVRPDGTFSVKFSMPDRRQVLPIVAQSSDGVEQRTIVLAVERNTKHMEPIIHQPDEMGH